MNEHPRPFLAASMRNVAAHLPDDPDGPHRVAKRVHQARQRRVAGAVLCVVVVVTAASVGLTVGLRGASGSAPPPRPASSLPVVVRGGDVPTAEYIDGPNSLFEPPPAGATPGISAEKTFDDFRDHGGRQRHQTLPVGLSYRNGRYTGLPNDLSYQLGEVFGPGTPGVLAWGFSSPPGPCQFGNGRLCVLWSFFNATTGRFLFGTGQTVSPPQPTPALSAPIAPGPVGTSPLYLYERSGRLLVQAPVFRLRWSMDTATCSLHYHWYEPAGDGSAAPADPCARNRFSTSSTMNIATRGNVFSAVGGHVRSAHRIAVAVVLADGTTTYPEIEGRTWFAVVERCGDFTGSQPTQVQLIHLVGASGGNLANDPVIRSISIPTGEQQGNVDELPCNTG